MRSFKNIVFGIIGLILFQIFLDGLVGFISEALPGVFGESFAFDISNPVYLFIRTIIIAPLYEELVYRKLLTKYFLTYSDAPFWLVNILQAALFGLLHWNLTQGIYGFVFGIAAGELYKKTRSIWWCVLVHAVINLVVFIQVFLFSTPS